MKTLSWRTRDKERSVLRRCHSSAGANGNDEEELQLVVRRKTGYLE